MRLILGGMKKSLVMVLGGGGPASRVHGNSRLVGERRFYIFLSLTRDLLGTRQGLVMMRFFCTLHGILHELGFLSTAAAAAADHR